MDNQIVNLLGAYKRYQEYKRSQYLSNAKLSENLRINYDKAQKKLPKYIQMRAVYNPPIVESTPESFADFMVWLKRDAEVNGLIATDKEAK